MMKSTTALTAIFAVPRGMDLIKAFHSSKSLIAPNLTCTAAPEQANQRNNANNERAQADQDFLILKRKAQIQQAYRNPEYYVYDVHFNLLIL